MYRVEADRRRDDLLVSYQEMNKEGKRVNRSREFTIEDRATRDAVFDALRERLGPGWRGARARAGRDGPIGTGLVGIVLTVVALFPLLWLTHWLQGPDRLDWSAGGSWPA